MILDWDKIWARYEKLEETWTTEADDTLWTAIEEHASVADDYRLQIDEVWNQMLEWYVGETTVDGVDYDLCFEDKLELQGAIQGAVELALRMQKRDLHIK